MNTLPIRTDGMEFTFLALVPKADQNGLQTRNNDGVPKWEAQLLCAIEQARRPEVIAVTITASHPPEIPPMTPVQLDNLIARHWSQGDRSGVAFSADSVRPSGKGRPPAPSTNGTKAEAVPV